PSAAAATAAATATADGADAEAARDFEDEEAFLGALLEGSVERSRAAFERILDRLRGPAAPARWRRFRLLSLLGSAYRTLGRRGLLGEVEAEAELDMTELLAAPEGGALELALRARYARIADRLGRIPHRSTAVAAAISYITRSFGGSLSLETAAEAVGLSPNRLSRLFVEETGRGFSDFLIQYRIERAKEMLLAPGASIKLVSAACGYPDPNYFSRLFKKVTGLTPTSFSSGITEANDAEL
ncbi:MAG: helix-turn-helix domain-containing protein, partial [Treponema sp.]|nr:helix-turn-helix domain-containing protein [Treponema sp.]